MKTWCQAIGPGQREKVKQRILWELFDVIHNSANEEQSGCSPIKANRNPIIIKIGSSEKKDLHRFEEDAGKQKS